MSHRFLLAFACAAFLASACDPDPCASQDATSAEIGRLDGASSFVPFDDGEPVLLGFAPQGGMGVFSEVRLTGLDVRAAAGIFFPPTLNAAVRIIGTDAEGNPDVYGDFPLGSVAECVDDTFGLATGITFGLNPDRFGFGPNPEDPNDPLTALDGDTVTLDVTVTDEGGQTANASVDVVLQVNP
jgi:hypothetical protein